MTQPDPRVVRTVRERETVQVAVPPSSEVQVVEVTLTDVGPGRRVTLAIDVPGGVDVSMPRRRQE